MEQNWAKVAELNERISNMDREIAQLRTNLAALNEAMEHAMIVIRTPVHIPMKEEGMNMIKHGNIAMSQMEIMKRQFQEWKDRYGDVVHAFFMVDKRGLEEKMLRANEALDAREKEVEEYKEETKAVRTLWSIIFNVG